MRDVTHLREKLEISLDDRQVAALVVSALLLLGGVFALGLLAGKRLAAATPRAAAVGDLPALDEEQRREAARPQPPVKPAPTVEPRASALAEPKASAPVEPKASAPVEPKASAPVEAPKVAQAATAVAARDDDEGLPESGKPPEELPPARAAAVAARTSEVPHPPAALPPPRPASATAKPPKPAPLQSAVVLSMPPRDPGDFTVQIGASQERSEAQRLENRARGAGLKPYVVEANLGAKGTWYRVRVGAFKDKDKAARFRHDVERELHVTAVVMPTR